MTKLADRVADRSNAIQSNFFAQHNDQLLKNLREELRLEDARTALSQATGIKDEHVLDHLVHEGVTAETAADIGLIPLIYVAWADGILDIKERAAVLIAAEGAGVHRGTAAYKLLTHWLEQRPDNELLEDWIDYVREVVGTFTPESRAAVKKEVIDKATRVAKAGSSVLELWHLSKDEQAAINRLTEAFS